MRGKMLRPKCQDVRSIVWQVSFLHKSLTHLLSSEATLKQDIFELLKPLRAESAHSQMFTIPIESLSANEQGLRLAALKNVGFRNVGQLNGKSIEQLTQIKSIDPDSAIKIKEATDRLYDTLTASAKVRIDLRKKNSKQNALVTKLFILHNSKKIRIKAHNLLACYPDLPNTLDKAKAAGSFFKWLFSGHLKKEAYLKAYHELINLVEEGFIFQAISIIKAYRSAIKGNLKEKYADFENNSISYYTILDKLRLRTSTSPAMVLLAQMVAKIEKYPLDLKYMKANLRQYQVFGAKYILQQGKALLGDEMGLGKTIVALAVIADLTAKGLTHFLVVCPASILVNWQCEVYKHSCLSPFIIHGFSKEYEFERWKNQGGLGITNYESLVKFTDQFNFEYGALVVDEAHVVKNPDTQRTKAVLAVSKQTKRIVYMTGTPLENKVDEMCFLVECLRPDIAWHLNAMKNRRKTEEFKKEIAPVYLRRVSWNVVPSRSTKARRLLEICKQAHLEDRKVIVFSFFLDTLNQVHRILGTRALDPITGSTPTVMRQQLIDQFTAAKSAKVLIAQVQVGGVGLNIQAASVIIFCEPQIKPSMETQAISRAYRMGQLRNVHVHRLLCVNTIDERMIKMLRGKQAEFDKYAEESIIGQESLKGQSESAWIKLLIQQEQALVASL